MPSKKDEILDRKLQAMEDMQQIHHISTKGLRKSDFDTAATGNPYSAETCEETRIVRIGDGIEPETNDI